MPYRIRARVLTVSEAGYSASVMVGPVRGPAHRDLIHRLGFYHVPVSAIAASRAGVSWIAFYEGAAQFRTAVGCVREYARPGVAPRRDTAQTLPCLRARAGI